VIAINKYELMLIVNPNADEQRQKEIVDRLRATIEKGEGNIAGVDEWGKKKLAYEIKKEPEGVYTVITFTATPPPSPRSNASWASPTRSCVSRPSG
jgi:small subunit ribosomal protein S6